MPGYDELNVQEIQKLLADGDDKLSARVRDYERPRKSSEACYRPPTRNSASPNTAARH